MTHHSLTYLACPYSHPQHWERIKRFNAVNKKASELMRNGVKVFSSISHSHPIAEAGGLPLDWEYWQDYDRAILQGCSKLIVLMLPGWKESKGVAAEIALATEMQIPVEYIEP